MRTTLKNPSMKTALLSAIVAMAFAYQSSGQVPIGPGAATITRIEPQGVKTPEFNITSGPTKRTKVGTWLEVEVEFETKAEDTPELVFAYTIMVENKLLTGTVTHINIPKGREHYSVMYIAPRSLEKLTGGKALTASSIQNVWIEIRSSDGVVIDKKGAPKNLEPPNLQRIPGMVLNKMETPFAPLFFDRYEAIKVTRQQ
jgi:hypothetical protein